jgi:hypothetical protein
VLKVEAEEWGGVGNSVETLVEGTGSPYTLYLPGQRSHMEDPVSASLGLSRKVMDNKEVAVS